MTTIEYSTPRGAKEVVHGSDARLDVSARADDRSFYVSRDNGQLYCLRIEDDNAQVNDIVAYLRNDSPNLSVFIRDIHFSSELAATIKIAYGDSTTATGTSVTPVNLNKTAQHAADVTALGNGAVGGVTAATFFSSMRVPANTTFVYHEVIILGQNDNIIIEYDTGSDGDIEIDIFFYMDTLD